MAGSQMRETKAIGILGGVSPESTVVYYQTIVRRHVDRFGDHSYPRIVIASVSFQDYIDWQHAGDWSRIAAAMRGELESLAAAGADFAVVASNTLHKVVDDLEGPIRIVPIFDAVAEACRDAGVGRCGLTGTRFTMSDGFFAREMEARGIEVISPSKAEQEALHGVIYRELIRGVVTDAGRAVLREIAENLVGRGAESVLLACTELMLLGGPPGLGVPTIDTTTCHADLAWRTALGG